MNTTLRFLPIIFLVLVTASCSDHDFNLNDPNVPQFVSLLKDGTYSQKVGFDLPHFDMHDVEQLIRYIGDTTEIREFPANPISSKRTLPRKLNECIMWTIDGIRFENRFPSLEPCLIDTIRYSEESGYSRLSNEQLSDLSKTYIDWYQAYKAAPSEALRRTDLLKNTAYKWN